MRCPDGRKNRRSARTEKSSPFPIESEMSRRQASNMQVQKKEKETEPVTISMDGAKYLVS